MGRDQRQAAGYAFGDARVILGAARTARFDQRLWRRDAANLWGARLDLKEEDLIKGGRHVLVAYHMKPKAGFDGYLATAAHFAAESSTATSSMAVP